MNRSWHRGELWWTSNFLKHQKVSRKMLLACMQCDFQSNGIFNILIIKTYIYVKPHFQSTVITRLDGASLEKYFIV